MMEASSERPSKSPTFTLLKSTSFYPEGQLILGCTETAERNEGEVLGQSGRRPRPTILGDKRKQQVEHALFGSSPLLREGALH
ncbi:hypothetical protein LEMLEM_LOCUS7446 [Lemmus lemmus]